MKRIQALGLAVASVLAAGSAHASFVYIDTAAPNRQSFSITARNNDFATQLGQAGVSNFNLGASLGTSAPGSVTIDYFGKEAVFTNSFQWAGRTLATTGSGRTDSWSARNLGTFGVGSGLLDFAFCTSGGNVSGPAVAPTCYSNRGEDSTPIGSPQSIGSWIVNGTTAWLLFDDGGAGPDDNHDDMIVRLTYQVPEPATLGLLALGLLGAGGTLRRRTRA